KFGEVDFGPDANRDMLARQLRWYNHYLKGEENGIDGEPPIEIFYMGANKWQHAQEWPLPGTKFTPFYLTGGGNANSARGDGALSTAEPSDAGVDRYTYDPNNPVPTVGANNCC